MTTSPALSRKLALTAAAAGDAKQHYDAYEAAVAERDKSALQAQLAGATYQELQAATGLSRPAVYKALRRANGDASLRDESQP